MARAALRTVDQTVRNRRRRPVELRLEPWGERYVVPAGRTVRIQARGPEAVDTLEIAHDEAGIRVYGWEGSVVSVSHAGRDLGAAPGERRRDRHPAPRIPGGMSMRAWIEALATIV